MPKTLRLIEVQKILSSGDFDEFIGALEDEQLEFKASPYQLDKDQGKMELAKDVSALANTAGGIIVIGVQTERNPTVQGDEAKKIGCFIENLKPLGLAGNGSHRFMVPPKRMRTARALFKARSFADSN